MKFSSTSFAHNRPLPPEFAFCVPDAGRHAVFGGNRNPGFRWSELPEGTKSLLLVARDPDAPSKPDDVNQEGRTVPVDLPRVDFYHWVLIDIPSDVVAIQPGEFSDGVTPRGKPAAAGRRRTRQGVNDYTKRFAGDADMAGTYFGYDGPCPPWNDALVHRYHFTLYAIDLGRCPVGGEFTAPDVLAAIEGHVLDETRVTGTYTLNPEAQAPALDH